MIERMTHEMLRADAEAAGYDTDGLPVLVAGDTSDSDVVNVWSQLPDADSVDVGPADEYGTVGADEPDDAFVAGLTAAVDDGSTVGDYSEPREVSDA